jgi:hypothetical protein
MARQVQIRRSSSEGKVFGAFMLAVVAFVVLLMWYFANHRSTQQLPQRPPGLVYRF